MPTPPKPKTIDDLKSELSKALASNDVAAITLASQAIVEHQKSIAKAEAEKARAEAEALSGKRTELATELTKTIKASSLGKANFSISVADVKLAAELVKIVPDIAAKVEAVKGTVISYKLPDEQSDTARVALAVVATKRTGTGTGGRAGKTKDEYGLTLHEVFEKFATAEDRVKLEQATSGSAQWQVKLAVKKAAIANGTLKPVS